MLVVHTTESEVEGADTILMKTSFKRMKYLLCKRSALKQRIVATHANEMLNAKTRHEILFQAKLNKIVAFKYKKCELGDLILSPKHQGETLFVAVE